MLSNVRVGGAEGRLVPDGAYAEELTRLIRLARERLWCSLFLIELNPQLDPQLRVPAVLRQLASAEWTGVDVRLLIGGSRSNLLIAEACATALIIARNLGIPARGLSGRDKRGSHVKLVVADDWVLTGSHNWSAGAFGDQVQDSVVIRSRDLASYLSNVFLAQWRRAAAQGVQP